MTMEFQTVEPSYTSKEGFKIVWKGIDEDKVQTILSTDLRPSSILCIGYPDKKKPPKSRRKLKDLIQVIE